MTKQLFTVVGNAVKRYNKIGSKLLNEIKKSYVVTLKNCHSQKNSLQS